VSTFKLLLAAALTCLGAVAIQAPAAAQQNSEDVRAAAAAREARARAADRALLEALLKRRDELAHAANGPDGQRAALDFLDRRIAEVRRRLGE
jgi:hypothetical protein